MKHTLNTEFLGIYDRHFAEYANTPTSTSTPPSLSLDVCAVKSDAYFIETGTLQKYKKLRHAILFLNSPNVSHKKT